MSFIVDDLCEPELWSLEEIYNALVKSKAKNNDVKIVIPMFQRGKRWEEKKEEGFIDSLEKRYPIGSLLFYKYDNTYSLIDGLQRGNTIKKYLSNPSKYFSPDKVPNEITEFVFVESGIRNSENIVKESINSIITNYIKETDIDDFEWSDLNYKICEKFPSFPKSSIEFRNLIKPFLNSYKEQVDSLRKTKIPVVVYSGDESTLPEIFERINSKGVALTPYEIYAASWPKNKFKIGNSIIIDKVLAKYDSLSDDDFEVEGYDRDDLRINHNVNAFDYVFGLSKFLAEEYSILNFQMSKDADEVNNIGFELLNACFFSAHNQIKNVHEIIKKFATKIDELEDKLQQCIAFVNKIIGPYIKFKGNKRSNKSNLHSQWQILSMISFVFRCKYNLNDLSKKSSWNSDKELLKKNMPLHYIYDIISNIWSEGGTNKIHSYNDSRKYISEIAKSTMENALISFNEKTLSRHERKQVDSPKSEEYIVLNVIYLNEFTAMDQLSIDKFDVEHICPKEQMKKLIATTTQNDGLPISALANLCYLHEGINRSKKDKNFYQDSNYLSKTKYSIDEIESKFSFTKEEQLEWMNASYNPNDYNILKEFYLEFLNERFKIIKEKFINSLY